MAAQVKCKRFGKGVHTLRTDLVVSITCMLLFSAQIQGAIRCFCNTPECQEKGHTCISHTEKCFSKLYTVYSNTQDNKTDDTPQDEHGCIDLHLASEPSHESICDGTGDVVKQLKTLEPLIMCCSDNMCNYRENQDIQVDIIDPPTISTEDNQDETVKERIREDNSKYDQDRDDLMFRVAVITVPIFGGLILIVLILLAVRMLREDYNRRYDSHGSGLEKAQNFIEQHFNKKDHKKVAHHKKQNATAQSSSDKLINSRLKAEHWLESDTDASGLLEHSSTRSTNKDTTSSRLKSQTKNHSSTLTNI